MNGKKIPYTPEGMKFFAKQKAAAKTGDASRGDLVYRPKGEKKPSFTPGGMKFLEKQKAGAKTGDAGRGDLAARPKAAKRAAIQKKMSGGK
jgi:hypothetical protein